MLEINILSVSFALFRVMISVCCWEMVTHTGRTWNKKTGNFKILIDKFSGMSFIDFSFTITHKESVHVVRMKPLDPQWTSKRTSLLPQKQMEKVLRLMEKSCVTRTFYSQLVSWDTQYQYETSEVVVQTPLINSNYWKQLITTFTRPFLVDYNVKWTM